MSSLRFMSPYLKGGPGGKRANYVRYFATRPGVELLARGQDSRPATEQQRDYIRRLLRAFPEAAELLEYEDYRTQPTRDRAAAFIRQAREDFAEPMSQRENYLDYVSHRPGVELRGDHGLWSSGGKVEDLSAAVREVADHAGNVWTPVVAIRRTDAERLGYDNAENWRTLVNACLCDIARGYKIHPDHLRWYAAFHRKENSVHIHMVVFSTDPKEGFLSQDGIQQVKSAFARRIFQQDLMHVYEQKTVYRDQLQRDAGAAMEDLLRQMRTGTLEDSRVERLLETLARQLSTAKGKKVYGYLPPRTKAVVDEIVDLLAADPKVAEAYDLWNEMREATCRIYQEAPPARVPLSRQKEFKPVRNMVVREALSLARLEDGLERPVSKAGEDAREPPVPSGPPKRIVRTLPCLVEAAEKGEAPAQYALARWYLDRGDTPQALRWLKAAGEQGHSPAQYRLGLLYLRGRAVEKDVALALKYLTASAEGGNAHAQYALGRLYLLGEDVPRDRELAERWLTRSADQGNPWAQAALDRPDQAGLSPVAQSASRMLYHMSRIFEDNCKTDALHRALQIDRKRRRQLRERRATAGKKLDEKMGME